jgi:class 3 adenylate cyclase
MISLRYKILGGFVAVVVLSISITVFSVTNLVENRVRTSINTNFVETGRIFERIQEIRFRQLRQTSALLANLQSLQAAISTGDELTINLKIREELKYLLDFDPVIPDTLLPESYYSDSDSTGLLLITDPTGVPIGQMSTRPLPDHSIADRPSIQQALRGRYPTTSTLWKQYDRFFNVISVPVYAGNRLIATLTYGFPIRRLEAVQLSKDTGQEVGYFIEDSLIVSSFDSLSDSELANLEKKVFENTFYIKRNGEAQTFELPMIEEQWLLYLTPMNQLNEDAGLSGYYILGQSLTQQLETLQAQQTIIILIGIGMLIIAVIISFVLTQRITRPIFALIHGIKEIEQGNYNNRVEVNTKDELKLLADTFNELVTSLRERLQMLKFVSDATLDAIKTNMSDISLGGQKIEVAVFFSDIRGFTEWSELREPEEVIKMLNTVLSYQADIVRSNGGDIDKFVGDELVAVFRGENKEQNAVKTAIEIQNVAGDLLKEYKDDIAVGIGINSGEVVMGAMGSEQRMDFTVLGNHVNLGARLCSAALPRQILISEHVYHHLERRIPVQKLKPIRVKGIHDEVNVFEVLWNEVTV